MDRDAYIEFENLEKGFYYVWVKMDWHDCVPNFKDQLEYHVNVYGSTRASLVRDPDEYPDKMKFLEKLFAAVCLSYEGTVPNDNIDVKLYQPPESDNGYYCIYIVNNDKKKVYTEKVEFSGVKGMKILDNHHGKEGCAVDGDTYTMEVGPGKKKLVICETKVAGYGFS